MGSDKCRCHIGMATFLKNEDMKNTAYIVISCLSALVLASCVKDDLYNTPHPDKGALVVTADFSERTEGNAIPDTYVLSVDGKTCDANSAEPFYYPELLPAGEHKLVAYNEPVGMSFMDNVVSVDVLQDGTIESLPQYLYSYSGSVEAVVDDTVRVTMPMEQRVRDLFIRFTVAEGDVARLASVGGTLSGVAGAFDIAGGAVTGAAMEVVPDFVVDGNSVEAHVRLLGMVGSRQTLSFNIVFTDGLTQTVESDVPEFLRDFGGDMLTPLELSGNLLLPLEPGFSFSITDMKTGEVENVDLY